MTNYRKSSIIAQVMAFVAILVLGVAGCAKVSHNGDLDGMWQVMEVYDGDEIVDTPVGLRCYYNFYLHTCQLSTADGRIPGLVGNMSVGDDKLAMDFPFVEKGEVDSAWIAKLKYWGVPETGKVEFDILQLNSKSLEMRNGNVRVVCRKF